MNMLLVVIIAMLAMATATEQSTDASLISGEDAYQACVLACHAKSLYDHKKGRKCLKACKLIPRPKHHDNDFFELESDVVETTEVAPVADISGEDAYQACVLACHAKSLYDHKKGRKCLKTCKLIPRPKHHDNDFFELESDAEETEFVQNYEITTKDVYKACTLGCKAKNLLDHKKQKSCLHVCSAIKVAGELGIPARDACDLGCRAAGLRENINPESCLKACKLLPRSHKNMEDEVSSVGVIEPVADISGEDAYQACVLACHAKSLYDHKKGRKCLKTCKLIPRPKHHDSDFFELESDVVEVADVAPVADISGEDAYQACVLACHAKSLYDHKKGRKCLKTCELIPRPKHHDDKFEIESDAELSMAPVADISGEDAYQACVLGCHAKSLYDHKKGRRCLRTCKLIPRPKHHD